MYKKIIFIILIFLNFNIFSQEIDDEYYKLNLDDLKKNLEVVNKNYTVYTALQYSSISLAFIGLFFVLIDAFIVIGDEFYVTPPSSETNPIPAEKVKSEFGGLTVSGGMLMGLGVAGAIGFSFPAKKYSVEKMAIKNEIKKIELNNKSEDYKFQP